MECPKCLQPMVKADVHNWFCHIDGLWNPHEWWDGERDDNVGPDDDDNVKG